MATSKLADIQDKIESCALTIQRSKEEGIRLEKELTELKQKEQDIIEKYFRLILSSDKDLVVSIHSGPICIISETGRVLFLQEKKHRERYEQILSIGDFKRIGYSEEVIEWRGGKYALLWQQAGACLCSVTEEGGGKRRSTPIVNIERGIPCANCYDPNVETYDNGTVKIY